MTTPVDSYTYCWIPCRNRDFVSRFQIRVIRVAQFRFRVTWPLSRGGLGRRAGGCARRAPRAAARSDWTVDGAESGMVERPRPDSGRSGSTRPAESDDRPPAKSDVRSAADPGASSSLGRRVG